MNKAQITAVVAGSLAVGGAAGYFIAKRRLENQFEQLFREEMETMRGVYSAMHKEGVYSTPAGAASVLLPTNNNIPSQIEEFEEHVGRLGYADISDEDFPQGETTENVFEQEEPDEEELGDPVHVVLDNDEQIVLITVDEFMEDGPNEKVSISYFDGDGVLADDAQQIIHDIDNTVTTRAFDYFGHHEGDDDTVYVRNKKLEVDFEITREDGSYTQMVLGIEPEPEDEPHRKGRRKKDDRDD